MSKPEKIVLNAETYDNILDMMNSVDGENKTVALSCIENVDFNQNISYIMCLKKQGNASSSDWEKHAPNTTKMLKGIGISTDSTLTWKQVIETMVKRGCAIEDIQFYLDRFGHHLHASIKSLGYEFIDTLEINIKVKTKDGEQTRTISEDIKRPNA